MNGSCPVADYVLKKRKLGQEVRCSKKMLRRVGGTLVFVPMLSPHFSPAQEFLILFASKNSPGDSQHFGSVAPIFGTLDSGIVRSVGSIAGQGQK